MGVAPRGYGVYTTPYAASMEPAQTEGIDIMHTADIINGQAVATESNPVLVSETATDWALLKALAVQGVKVFAWDTETRRLEDVTGGWSIWASDDALQGDTNGTWVRVAARRKDDDREDEDGTWLGVITVRVAVLSDLTVIVKHASGEVLPWVSPDAVGAEV